MTTVDPVELENVLEQSSSDAWRPGTFGMELQVDVGGCNLDAIRNPEVYRAFLTDLVKRIGMTAFGQPLIVPFGKGSLYGVTAMRLNPGPVPLLKRAAAFLRRITAVRRPGMIAAAQLITTSNITIHGVDAKQALYANVFSCERFHPAEAIAVILEHFGTDRSRYIDRVTIRRAPEVAG